MSQSVYILYEIVDTHLNVSENSRIITKLHLLFPNENSPPTKLSRYCGKLTGLAFEPHLRCEQCLELPDTTSADPWTEMATHLNFNVARYNVSVFQSWSPFTFDLLLIPYRICHNARVARKRSSSDACSRCDVYVISFRNLVNENFRRRSCYLLCCIYILT